MCIGDNLKKLRVKSGLNQRELSQKIGIGQSMLAQIERGTKTLSLPLAATISEELGCSIYDIIGDEIGEDK